MRIGRRLAAVLIVLAPAMASAHHGSGISYDVDNLWTTWATVVEFNYKNPHPTMTFERTTKDGTVERWLSELLTAPAALARAGWTRGRSEEALKPGARVKLFLGTARVGGTSAIVMRIENDKGEELLSGMGRARPNAKDMDGIALGLQPSGNARLPRPTGSD